MKLPPFCSIPEAPRFHSLFSDGDEKKKKKNFLKNEIRVTAFVYSYADMSIPYSVHLVSPQRERERERERKCHFLSELHVPQSFSLWIQIFHMKAIVNGNP